METIKELNHYIDSVKEQEEATTFILNYYKEQLGVYPGTRFLNRERQRLSKHLFKSKDFYNKLVLANRTLRLYGVQLYLETMEV